MIDDRGDATFRGNGGNRTFAAHCTNASYAQEADTGQKRVQLRIAVDSLVNFAAAKEKSRLGFELLD